MEGSRAMVIQSQDVQKGGKLVIRQKLLELGMKLGFEKLSLNSICTLSISKKKHR